MFMKKIYIMGPVGSGKTTFSKGLAKKLHIKRYELDKVAWNDDIHVKRSDDDVKKIFSEILKHKSWIMEDVGRDKFLKGREEADIIYYIRISRLKSYYRVTKRWIRQRLGLESYNYPPTIGQWFYFISTVHSYYAKEKVKLKNLEAFQKKVVFVNTKEIKRILEQ